MRMDKFTSKFQSALADAQSLAVGRDHQYIEPLHLMLAMLQQQGNSVSAILNQIGAAPMALSQDIEAEINKLPQVSGSAGSPEPVRQNRTATSRSIYRFRVVFTGSV